jgi:hypothetical protein
MELLYSKLIDGLKSFLELDDEFTTFVDSLHFLSEEGVDRFEKFDLFFFDL